MGIMDNVGKVYYVKLRNNDMNWNCIDYYSLCYLVYGLCKIDWIDIDDILISYIEWDPASGHHEKGYLDPVVCFDHFVEDLAN